MLAYQRVLYEKDDVKIVSVSSLYWGHTSIQLRVYSNTFLGIEAERKTLYSDSFYASAISKCTPIKVSFIKSKEGSYKDKIHITLGKYTKIYSLYSYIEK